MITFAVVALTLMGCARGHATMIWTRLAPTSLSPRDVVGVIVVPAAAEQEHGKKVAKCVESSLAEARMDVRNIKASDVFGDDPASLSLADDAAWRVLLSDRDFRSRVAALGLTHLVVAFVSETTGSPTDKTEFGGGGGGSRGGPGFIVFGLDVTSTRELKADVQAVVVDLKSQRLAARVSATGWATSHSGVVMLYFLIPIPHWSSPSSFDPACKNVGRGIARAMVLWTSDPETLSACDFVGVVKDDDWDHMVKKVLRLRGNAVLLPEGVHADAPMLGDKFYGGVEARIHRCETERLR